MEDKVELSESSPDITFWKRICKNSIQKPHSGFDCSNLVLRAAQLAGIKYYYKNTATLMMSKIHQVKSGEKINRGDIACYTGHVFVILDPERNIIIEAAGYGVGFGKVQTIPLLKVYKGVNKTQDLLTSRPIYRLNNLGEVFGKPITDLKIFRFIGL